MSLGEYTRGRFRHYIFLCHIDRSHSRLNTAMRALTSHNTHCFSRHHYTSTGATLDAQTPSNSKRRYNLFGPLTPRFGICTSHTVRAEAFPTIHVRSGLPTSAPLALVLAYPKRIGECIRQCHDTHATTTLWYTASTLRPGGRGAYPKVA